MLGLVPSDIIERSPGSESKWFIKDQTFLPSYDLAPLPPIAPSPVSKVSLFLSLSVCRAYWQKGGTGGGSRGRSESYEREKSWSSINHSILSAQAHAPFAGIDLYQHLPPSAHTATLPYPLFLNLSSLCVELEVCIVHILRGRGRGANHTTEKA